MFGKMQQVAQHHTLGGRQVAIVFVVAPVFSGFFLMLDDFFFQLLTQRGFMVPPKYQRAQALPYSAISIVVGS